MTADPVALVFFSGCPHVDTARANLEAALSRAGRPAQWREWDLEDPAAPSWAAGHASPTVLVEGRDVGGHGPAEAAGGLSCRAQGAPTVDQIVAALSARDGARSGGP